MEKVTGKIGNSEGLLAERLMNPCWSRFCRGDFFVPSWLPLGLREWITTKLVGGYTNLLYWKIRYRGSVGFRNLLLYLLWIDQFRVPLRLSFKASLRAKFLSWQLVLISIWMATDIHFALRLFLKETEGNSQMANLSSTKSPFNFFFFG